MVEIFVERRVMQETSFFYHEVHQLFQNPGTKLWLDG
jgi:hypothetical protein